MTDGIISTHENALLAADEILRIIHHRLFREALPMNDHLFPDITQHFTHVNGKFCRDYDQNWYRLTDNGRELIQDAELSLSLESGFQEFMQSVSAQPCYLVFDNAKNEGGFVFLQPILDDEYGTKP